MIASPPARWIAPSTPPPPASAELAALTIASVGILVMSPSVTDSTRPGATSHSSITSCHLRVASHRPCPIGHGAKDARRGSRAHGPTRGRASMPVVTDSWHDRDQDSGHDTAPDASAASTIQSGRETWLRDPAATDRRIPIAGAVLPPGRDRRWG